MDTAELLLGTPIFRDLTPRDVAELLPVLRERVLVRGETVWGEGSAAEELYIVAEGQLKSYRVSRDGAEVIVGIASGGEILGQIGLFHPSGVRQVCMAAMEPSRCLTLAKEPLLAFMTRYPAVMRRMLESVTEIAVRAAHSWTEVAFDDIRRRVARTLLALAKEQGEPTALGLRIRLKLSQTTLAAMVAASRENVNRALGSLMASGAVSQREGFFLVHDQPALEAEVADAV